MTWLDLFALSAATFAILRGWFRSDATAAAREKARLRRDDDRRMVRLVGYLMSCPPCLAVEVSMALSFLFLAPAAWLDAPWATTVKMPIYALAGAALFPISWVEPKDGLV